MSKIPVFVSSPTSLNTKQDKFRRFIIDVLDELNMEARALGRSDYPKDYPLKEIAIIAKRCSGGIILGFEQMTVKSGTWKGRKITDPMLLPTPWNQIETGILFGLKLPLLIFKEDGITGGIFDLGTTEVFIHRIPEILNPQKKEEIKQVVLKWFAEVTIIHNQF